MKDSIKNEGVMNGPRINVDFFRCSRAYNSIVRGGILPKFELIQAFMRVLVTCKNEEDPIENEGTRVATTFTPS